MKITKKILLILLIVLSISVCCFFACDKNEGAEDNSTDEQQQQEQQEKQKDEKSSNFTITETNKSILFGDEVKLTVVGGSVDSSKYIWNSTDSNVVTVNHGVVTAVGQGEADVIVVDGTNSSTCHIKVSFGDLLPSLSISNIENNSIIIKKGKSYPIEGKIQFNGKQYDTILNITSKDNNVCSINNNEVVGNSVGNTTIDVKTVWNGFDNSFLQKSISVKVDYNVSLYSDIEIAGKKIISDTINLSIVDSWSGNNYNNTAKIKAVVKDDGVEKNGTISIKGDGILELNGDRITAKKVGKTIVTAEYTNAESKKYSIDINVNVECPIVEYTDKIDVCTTENFDIESYFGVDAKIVSVKQNNKLLSFNGNKINGLVPNGEDTNDIEICTTNGGYLFTNIFAYTLNLTKDNFVSTLKLSNKSISGYYVMKDDILDLIDMTNQIGNTESLYFAGTFNGLGHTLNVKVASAGLFGELLGATIKNTHFNFTFDTTNGLACGLANNNANYTKTSSYVTLDNLYITTTNYGNNTYSLFNNRCYNLKMNDIYVVLGGVLTDDFTDVTTQEFGALFHNDHTSMTGPYGMFSGDFKNIVVVTSKFMPMSNTKWDTVDWFKNQIVANYVNYAKNDISMLGSTTRAGASSDSSYCKVFSNTDNTMLFGKAPWNNSDGIVYYAWLYESSVANGGVLRYDTVSDVESAGITSIGSWTTDGSFIK